MSLVEGSIENLRQDTVSVCSESTSGTIVSEKYENETQEALLAFAEKMGFKAEDLHQERFRVDRKKLERMMLGDIGMPGAADTFFHKVMEETNTLVVWPSRLKIGAKNKKDPYIKVIGRLEDAHTCKNKIMQTLDPRHGCKVTMKLDVSYTDHSHIIGKGGLTIKRAMEETACHIHFPDSNRSNHQEKSNQVSISGELEGVERARAKVRSITPLIFSFEFPRMNSSQGLPESTSPHIVKIQEDYNVQVMFRERARLNSIMVIVKGYEWQDSHVEEATATLINHFCQHLASQTQVKISMEISPQHHSIVLGKQGQNLKIIMQRTGTKIFFPDAGDPCIPSLKKSSVNITGAIRNVFLARQMLIGSLPLVLMFDLPDDAMGLIDSDKINQLMLSLDVFINVRHKPKQNTMSVVIKGIERNASNIYEARHQLLNLDEARVHAEIPATYHIPSGSSVIQGSPPSATSDILGEQVQKGIPTTLAPTSSNSPFHPSIPQSPGSSRVPPVRPWCMPSIFSPMALHTIQSPYPYPPGFNSYYNAQQMMQNGMMGPGMPGNPAFSNFNQMNHLSNAFHRQTLSDINFQSLSADVKDSGYNSLSSVTSSMSSPAISPRNVSPDSLEDGNSSFGNSISKFSSARRAPGCEKKSFEIAGNCSKPFIDHEQKKIMAVKAMQSKIDPKVARNPTSAWSGYGLSQSSPNHLSSMTEQCEFSTLASNIWSNPTNTATFNNAINFVTEPSDSEISASNHLDYTSPSTLQDIQNSDENDNLAVTLTRIGVQKYIHLFVENEIDIATFRLITDKDLLDMGITAWGPRRKIMLKIADMNSRSNPLFSGSAAPGAERRMSLSAAAAVPIPASSLGSLEK